VNLGPSSWVTHRHKTALHRKEISKPVRIALQDGLLSVHTSLMDYGCGRGEDVRQLRELGIQAHGWDPVFHPHGEIRVSDIVNLGYVVNVIESARERDEVLKTAWSLAQNLLIVSARSNLEDPPEETARQYSDGVITRLGTFQKYYDQIELKNWILSITDVEPLPAAPGIFLVFRDEALRESWRAQRYRRKISIPKVVSRETLYRSNIELLEPVMAFFTERGRLPSSDEVCSSDQLINVFGSIPRAFTVVRHVTGDEIWDSIRDTHKADLLVWLALCRFHVRPIFSALPEILQRDIRGLFGAYVKACDQADSLLLSVGQSKIREGSMLKAPFGKLMPKGLYVHMDYLDQLPPVLRLFEGCARALIGGVSGATLVKFHRDGAQVSYLTYENFERNPHPELLESILVTLDGLKITRRNYREQSNRFVLHRKETFIPQNAPSWQKFHRLTLQEERLGLFQEPSQIGTKLGWANALLSNGCRLSGHRLVRIRKENE